MMRQQRKFISLAVSAVVSHATLEQEMHTASTTSHHITAAVSFFPGQRLLRAPSKANKNYMWPLSPSTSGLLHCILHPPAHTSPQKCWKQTKLYELCGSCWQAPVLQRQPKSQHSFLLCSQPNLESVSDVVKGFTMVANSLQHQNALYLLSLMKYSPPKTGESFPLVPSQDKDGILWLNNLVGCKWSKCGFPCESCWVIQIPSCGRKWASRDSWDWKRWVTSRHVPVGLWREPLSLAEKQSCFLRGLLWVL